MKPHMPYFYPYLKGALLSYEAASFGVLQSKYWETMPRTSL